MSEHFIEKCRVCHRVISQCRCPDLNKPVRWSICSDCAKSPKMTDEIIDRRRYIYRDDGEYRFLFSVGDERKPTCVADSFRKEEAYQEALGLLSEAKTVIETGEFGYELLPEIDELLKA